VTPEALSYAEARARVLAASAPLPPERLPLERAAGRALRADLVAPHGLPPFRNAAMDGYALRAADLASASRAVPVHLPVVAVIPAGRIAPRPLAPGEAMRIMTGAAVPAGADTIVPFEECERSGEGAGERVRVFHPSRPGDHVRDAGADVTTGETVLEQGRELSPHDLALAGSLGFAVLEVSPRPRAIVLSTGDELLEPDQPLVPGAIRDSNRPMLAALLEGAGATIARTEHLPDDPQTVAMRLRAALAEADVVCTIGGVSAGDFDPVKLALASVGDIALWRVSMRPGRPQAFGAPGGRLCFGLPGNPASVACVFEALVRPALRRLQGFAALDRPCMPARAAVRIDSRAGRTDFVRVTLAWRGGEVWAAPAGAQVSGHLAPQSRAHALLRVPDEVAALEPGDAARAFLLRWPDGA
jgi:molybdopterin molybdotransferase